ncbi:hypothetical protein X777_10843 [Ooceraea biroi]|uniref:Uncharacterized protein n=1 Tax=Ooceraea biroi TaxID=2015173 RepID=A0A026W456_OOCBI|nr:hypothetical protein X777_10843 [Ooceraea biroi]
MREQSRLTSLYQISNVSERKDIPRCTPTTTATAEKFCGPTSIHASTKRKRGATEPGFVQGSG